MVRRLSLSRIVTHYLKYVPSGSSNPIRFDDKEVAKANRAVTQAIENGELDLEGKKLMNGHRYLLPYDAVSLNKICKVLGKSLKTKVSVSLPSDRNYFSSAKFFGVRQRLSELEIKNFAGYVPQITHAIENKTFPEAVVLKKAAVGKIRGGYRFPRDKKTLKLFDSVVSLCAEANGWADQLTDIKMNTLEYSLRAEGKFFREGDITFVFTREQLAEKTSTEPGFIDHIAGRISENALYDEKRKKIVFTREAVQEVQALSRTALMQDYRDFQAREAA